MKIRKIDSYNDLLSLEDIWTCLLEQCDHSVFSTWEWISIWWKNFGSGRKLSILLAEENGQVIGIAPLMYSVYSMYGLRKVMIEFIGTPISDYADFLIADRREECLNLFFKYLRKSSGKWGVARLDNFRGNSANLGVLQKFSNRITPICSCPYISLPKSFEEYLNFLSPNMRRNIKRGSRILSEKYDVEFLDCSGVQFYSYGAHWLFELHQKRWLQKGYFGAFVSSKIRRFHTEIMESFAKKGWLRLFVLKLSGVPVAVCYGFQYGKKFYSYLQGLDPDPAFFRYAVGNQIIAYIIAKCIEDKLVEFDFMRGAEHYKSRWHTLARWNFEVVIPRDFVNALQYSVYQKFKIIRAPLERFL